MVVIILSDFSFSYKAGTNPSKKYRIISINGTKSSNRTVNDQPPGRNVISGPIKLMEIKNTAIYNMFASRK
ncbi:MAG: hypothetical protein V1802_00410 [Candidatus Aenigmatarchaeota archaeon]